MSSQQTQQSSSGQQQTTLTTISTLNAFQLTPSFCCLSAAPPSNEHCISSHCRLSSQRSIVYSFLPIPSHILVEEVSVIISLFLSPHYHLLPLSSSPDLIIIVIALSHITRLTLTCRHTRENVSFYEGKCTLWQ